MRRWAPLLLALPLASCGVLRQIRPDWTLVSEQVRLRGEQKVFDAAVTALAIDVSGRYAAAGSYDGALAIFDLEEEELLGAPFRAPGGRAGVAGIEPGAEPAGFAALLSDGRVVELAAGKTPQVTGEPGLPSGGVPSCRIVRGEGVRVRPTPRSAEFLLPEARATAAAVRGERAAVASGASPGTFRLQVLEGGRSVFETSLGSLSVSLAFHPTRSELAVGGSGEVVVFDYRAGERVGGRTLRGAVHVAYDPRGRFLYALHGEQLTVLSAEGAKEVASLSGHRSASLALAVHPDGSLLVTGGTRGEIWSWEVR
ncbi:MAG TPA: hypothetical protein VFI25_15595 [Planctomycetota bacterium]|jgi:WD40 repeat protein|nr:hypothetical protein [Planctomycetota bacterium]